MKNQALFSSKDKSKKKKMSSAAIFFGALRVKNHILHGYIRLITNSYWPHGKV